MISPIRLDITHQLLSMKVIYLSKPGLTPCLSSAGVINPIEVLPKDPWIPRKTPKVISCF
jgi:hypothetical protein